MTAEGAGGRRWSSWKMHLLFTPRVLFFGGLWRKVRNVSGREYRSLSSRDEREHQRSFHVRAHRSAVQESAVSSKNRENAKERFAQSEHGRHTSFFERTEDASAQSSQAALQNAEACRCARPTKGLRSTPRGSPPNNEALTHHRGWRAVPALASGP